VLLSPEQVNTAMRATEMTLPKAHFAMSDDSNDGSLAAAEPVSWRAADAHKADSARVAGAAWPPSLRW
jgi:hypothetical protein